jgi:hypothetical protein
MNSFDRFVTSALMFFIGVGLVWVAAWAFHPNLTSGTVWFIAVLFGVIDTDLAKIALRQKGEW